MFALCCFLDRTRLQHFATLLAFAGVVKIDDVDAKRLFRHIRKYSGTEDSRYVHDDPWVSETHDR